MKTDKTELFETTPVIRAVLALVIPTVISQMATVVYNMADTFFIGQLNDADQVAAASLSLPLFLLTTGMANLFGIGGASLISRSLGLGTWKRPGTPPPFVSGRRLRLRWAMVSSSMPFAGRSSPRWAPTHIPLTIVAATSSGR